MRLAALLLLLLAALLIVAHAQPYFTWSIFPSTGSAPAPRGQISGALVTFPDGNQKYIVYGGAQSPAATGLQYNDMWAFDLNTLQWNTVPATGNILQPARLACVGGAMTSIDQVALVMFGGADANTFYDDLYIFDINKYTFALQQFPANSQRPQPRRDFVFFKRTDLVSNQKLLYVFGGSSDKTLLNDFWYWTPSTLTDSVSGSWTIVPPNIGNNLVPPPVSSPSYAFDADSDVLYLWGGRYDLFNWASLQEAATYMWKYDFQNNNNPTWSKIPMISFPVIYDACSWEFNRSLYMYGGTSSVDGTISASMYIMDTLATPPLRWVQFTSWTLDPNTTWPKVNGVQKMDYRTQQDCQVVSSWPSLGIRNSVMMMFGGSNNKGTTNDMYVYDLSAKVWYWVQKSAQYPTPRSFHSIALIGINIYLIGGRDGYGNLIDDFWVGTLTVTSDNSDVSGITWAPVVLSSPLKPPPRAYSASVETSGLFFLFGGTGNNNVILGDFWKFDPSGLNWRTITSGNVPPARYGHTMVSNGRYIYMFGGIKTSGQTDELWLYDVNTALFSQVTPAFPGAIWPARRAFHSAGFLEVLMTPTVLAVIQNYVQTVQNWAANILNSYNDLLFPEVSSGSPSEAYKIQVKAALNSVIKKLGSLTLGQGVSFMTIYGGQSSENDGFVMGDMVIFDPITSLWQVPANFKSTEDPNGNTGRKFHTMRNIGSIVSVHGGRDDDALKSASPMYRVFYPNAAPGYTYPFTSMASNLKTDRLIGIATDLFDGGVPPSPMQFTASQFISLPPVLFSAVGGWTYTDGNNLTVITDPVSYAQSFSPTNAWGSVGMVMGHASVKIASSIIYIGGIGSLPNNTAGVPVPTATNMKVVKARLDPVCLNTTATTYPQFQSKLRQFFPKSFINDTSNICALCSKGTFYNFNQGSESQDNCDLCSPGTYSSSDGTVNQCDECPAGYYNKLYGSTNRQSCLPCPFGTYTQDTGSTSCTACGTGVYCEVGASSQGSLAPTSYSTESQPAAISDNSTQVLNVQLAIFGIGAAIVLVVSLSFCLFASGKCKQLRLFFHMESADFMFSSKHRIYLRKQPLVHHREMWKEFYMTEWNTEMGGCFSLCSCTGVLVVIVMLGAPFLLNNIVETRSYIPNSAIPASVFQSLSTDIVFSVSMAAYGGACTTTTTSSVCVSEIVTSFVDMNRTGTSVTCQLLPNGCQLNVKLTSAVMLSNNPQITIVMNEAASLSNYFNWSMSFTSGIQTYRQPSVPGGQLSAFTGSIIPSKGYMFRGSKPTVLNFDVTASSFNSIFFDKAGYGYVASLSSVSQGTKIFPASFALTNGLSFQVNMSRVLSSAQTTQATKWSYSQVAAQLGGAVAAVIFIAGTVLNIFEDLVFRPKGWGDELRINEARVRQDMELREKEDADEARMLALVVEQQRCRRLGLPIPSLKKVDEEHVVKRKQRVVKTAVPTLRPEEIASTSGADPILLTREANSHYLQNLVKKAQTQVNTDDTKKHTLTIDEIANIRNMWDAVDRDQSGTITLDELGDLLKVIPGTENIDKKGVQRMMKLMDSDGSGTVEWEEFLHAFAKFTGMNS